MELNVEILIKGVGILELNTKDADEFGIPLTFNIADIKDISKRKGSFSKTVRVLGTKANNIIFNHLYEIRGQSFTFNMTTKHDCILMANKNPVMEGYLVLKKITKLLVGHKYEVVYEVNIFNEVKNFFNAIEGKELFDLDFSTGFVYSGTTETLVYGIGDHDISGQTIGNTINAKHTYTEVYTYPIVNYGYNLKNNTFPYTSISNGIMYPAVFQKAIWDKIFVDAGYSYESEYLDGTSYAGFFGNMLNLYNKERNFVELPLCEYVSDGAFAINATGFRNVKLGRYMCSLSGINTDYYELDDYFYQDGPNIKGIEVPVDGDYYLRIIIDVSSDAGGVAEYPCPAADPADYRISYYDLQASATTVVINWTGYDLKDDNDDTSFFFESELIEFKDAKKGDYFWVSFRMGYRWEDYDFEICNRLVEQPIVANGTSLELFFKRDLELSGSTSAEIKINEVLPEMTQVEFIKNHIKMANLYIWSDQINPTKLYIEPRDDFYKKGTIENWTTKIDYNRNIEVKTLNDNIANNIKFEYTEGDDYYSQIYSAEWGETYGTKEVDLDNPYLKENQLVKLDYQSYLMDGVENNLLYSPLLYEDSDWTWFNDKGKFNPLIGFNYNEPAIPDNRRKMAHFKYGSWFPRENAKMLRLNYASHAKVMGGLSFDLNFETTGQTFTLSNYDRTRGLYKIFWENYINNLIDDDSRVVTYYINLTINDILTLDFRNRILIEGQMYILQKIDYDITKIGSSKVVLLKETDPVSDGSFEEFYLLKNAGGDYITTNAGGDKIIIN